MSDLRGENAFLKKEIAHLKVKNENLNTRMMEIEKYSGRNNVLIGGFPEKKEERVRDIVHGLAEHLQVNLKDYHSATAHRLPSRRSAPPNIVVKLNNNEVKASFIGKVKKVKPEINRNSRH